MNIELIDMGDPVLGKVIQRRPLEKLTLELRGSRQGSASKAGRAFHVEGIGSGTRESLTNKLPARFGQRWWKIDLGSCCLLKTLNALGSFILQVLKPRRPCR